MFHVQPLERTIEFHRKLYCANKKTTNDWRIIHAGSKAECSELADACRGTLQERDREKVSLMQELDAKGVGTNYEAWIRKVQPDVRVEVFVSNGLVPKFRQDECQHDYTAPGLGATKGF